MRTDPIGWTRRRLLQALLPAMAACSPLSRRAIGPSNTTADTWIDAQRLASMAHLLGNISPARPVDKKIETKYIAADRTDIANMAAHGSNAMIVFDDAFFRQRIVAVHGAVAAAAPSASDQPDYYFHWLRDSSLIMRAVVDSVNPNSPFTQDVVRRVTIDFINFTRQIQRVAEPIGLGEPRFNLDGSIDVLKWSRPQNDGPALRALALLRLRDSSMPDDVRADLDDALRADLDFVAGAWALPSFDLWEEYDGHDYHARVSQYAALQRGAEWARLTGDNARSSHYASIVNELSGALDTHWLPDKNYYGFFVGPKTHWSGVDHEKPGDNLDSAVIVGVVHAALDEGRHSVLDDRVMSTAMTLETFFATALPINRRRNPNEGIPFGRYANDTYFGDNAYVMISLEFAQFYFMTASAMARNASTTVTVLNRDFLASAAAAAGRRLQTDISRTITANERLDVCRGLIAKGDAILRRIHRLSPNSGELSEQLDGKTGAPASCRDLSWSHAGFLMACRRRQEAVATVQK